MKVALCFETMRINREAAPSVRKSDIRWLDNKMAPPVSPFYHALQLALMHPERE
jgi:hypothetical protein